MTESVPAGITAWAYGRRKAELDAQLADRDSTLAQFSVKIDVLRAERDAAEAKLAAIRELIEPRARLNAAHAAVLDILDGSMT